MQLHLIQTLRLSNQSLRIMASVMRENAIDPAPWLAEAGIDGTILTALQGEVTCSQELQFQQYFADATRCIPGLWVRTGLRYRVMAYGPLGLAVLAASNVSEGLQVLGAFQGLTFSLMHYAPQIEDGQAIALTAHDDDAPASLREFLQERALGSVTMFLNDMQPPRFPLRHIESSLERPAGWQECDVLLGVPVFFGAETTRWVFEKGAGELPLPMASPLLEETYSALCKKLVATAPVESLFVGQVFDLLVRSGRGFPFAADVARQLSVSERTLHRRLDSNHTSFGKLLDRIRHERALDLLGKSTLSIERIAEMLGFSETSSFTRAFKRWEGVSPQQHRRI
ncbi:MAG: AraC family transcriptional regulator [Sphingomonas sp.]|nr:MAG: AraC family transcriptional regulator [Sphingomonas sp.]